VNDARNSDNRRKTLEAIHDSAVDAIVTIDHRGIIETVNPATERLFGYSISELVGNNVKLLMPNPFHDEHDRYLQNYLTSGVRKIIGIGREVVARKKDGTIFPVHLAISEVPLDDRRVFAGFVRDLSDLKLIEKERTTLGRIIEDSLNEVYIFDAETLKFIRVNHGALHNLGYSQEELQQMTPVDLKPDFTETKFQEFIRPLLAGEKDRLSFSTTHRRKNGTIYHVEVFLQLTEYLNRQAFVAIILDVTKRKQAEEQVRLQQEKMQTELERLVATRTRELRQAQEELVLNEKFSTLGKVSGGIAHEIRNPLNAVKTSAYFLLNAKNPSPEKVKEHLDRIDRQVSLIDNVIAALSDVAKLPDAHLIPLAMPPILRKVVASMKLPRNINVVFDFPKELPDVMADENQIVIAFRNLIRNARDAMAAGGKLTVGARVDDAHVVFAISDTGKGILDNELGQIMEPLFTTKARGMGLGLSISKAIVEKNRGSLSVKSQVGVGSEFSVSLRTK
jgi:two-component system sensor kinase FixL